jgi:hypothetical protein
MHLILNEIIFWLLPADGCFFIPKPERRQIFPSRLSASAERQNKFSTLALLPCL